MVKMSVYGQNMTIFTGNYLAAWLWSEPSTVFLLDQYKKPVPVNTVSSILIYYEKVTELIKNASFWSKYGHIWPEIVVQPYNDI